MSLFEKQVICVLTIIEPFLAITFFFASIISSTISILLFIDFLINFKIFATVITLFFVVLSFISIYFSFKYTKNTLIAFLDIFKGCP